MENSDFFTLNSRIFREIDFVYYCTVWKFGNFSATQILREINFCKSGVSKSTILIVSERLNFDFSEFLQFVRAEHLCMY